LKQQYKLTCYTASSFSENFLLNVIKLALGIPQKASSSIRTVQLILETSETLSKEIED
jgi:hypothetical protein